MLQVQSVTQTSQKLEKAHTVLECMRSDEEDRDASTLHQARLEFILVGKECLSSESFEQWAELLMKEASPAATKRRRLVCMQADVPLQKQTQ